MTDLETLLRNKQDELRGRPRDWIDDFGDWRRSIDWALWLAVAVVAVPLALVAWVLVLP